ncbi:hypothetical protein R2601_03893 [Salipiger bermudensis HTCC2601]|uniref:Uncharacterized protein n=1 Tax=Salipiger bermudensis (strain DSM 26914 / JCM 13377 / KCTC 12554 / HTCC2601) TaxID=314265 RepID=Q0FW67_SALBH|nr:hypothetical protein R2601_03893 [Salipiger bermudensis HTCC2601]
MPWAEPRSPPCSNRRLLPACPGSGC